MTAYKVHDLTDYTMREAYDFTQYSDDLHDGDVMRTNDGWAVMVEAWPVMVDAPSETFHHAAPDFHKQTADKYRAQWDAVRTNADELARAAIQHSNDNP
jgi:hypothetical protein